MIHLSHQLQVLELDLHHQPQDILALNPQAQDILVLAHQALDILVPPLLQDILPLLQALDHLLLIHTLSVLNSLLLTAQQLLATGDQNKHLLAQLLHQLCQRTSVHLLKQLHTGILKIANGHVHQLDSANGMYQQELYHHMIMIHASNHLIQLLALLIHNAHGKITLLHQLFTQLHSVIHLWHLEPLTQ
jgi:hypothetical protein